MKSKLKKSLIEVKDLQVSFPLDEGLVRAVEDVNLTIHQGEVLGVVGESGCGKSVTAQSIMQILPYPGKIDRGEILFCERNGSITDIAQLKASGKHMRQIRGKEIAMIFQEPMSSFSPIHTIGNQIMEAILLHQKISKADARKCAAEMLDRVGIPNANKRLDDYPFEFSGGMRQRAMTAMALSCDPALLIADEPTTALDVTIQAQILKLMKDIQCDTGTAILFITHNLGVIAQIADRIAIMYLGKIVEEGPVSDIFTSPKHPYTVNLLRAIPRIGKTEGKRLVSIKGSVPGPLERPKGCPFHARCEELIPGHCDIMVPTLIQINEEHQVRCFLYE
jgi:oligopeptide/dipeptide ABC transporter ATP-binding protein